MTGDAMCYERREEEFARACRERDEANAELQKVIAEMHEVKSENAELEAAFDGAKQSMKALNEQLVKVTAERDAMGKIIAGGIDACDHCAHEKEGLCGNTCECAECPTQCVCGTCDEGSHFQLRKQEDE